MTLAFSKKIIPGILLTCLLCFAGFSTALARDYYQIKIYSLDSEQQEQQLDQYFETAYLPALHRAGIAKVGVFKPHELEENTDNFIMVLIPFKSLDEFEKLDGKLKMDKKYLKAGTDYIEADPDNVPYKRIQSILLRAFTGMPEFGVPTHTTPASEQVYELRSYEGPTEKKYETKVAMFNDEGECQLFKDLDFQPVFFGEVISGAAMPNLMYLTTFSSKESQTEHWNSFRTNEEWLRMKEIPKYKKTVSHSDKFYLFPTEYSDL